jgi:hypothetical protein
MTKWHPSFLLWLAVVLLAPTPRAAAVRQQKPATAAIGGTVRNGVTGTPIPRAVVALRSSGTGAPLARIVRQLADEDGRFVFRELPAFDNYTLTATKIGYVDGEYGQRTMFGPPGSIALSEGQAFTQADILLWKPGAISGRVVDERREPLVGVFVRALAQHYIAGQRKLVGGPAAKTDDRGEYRIAGLPPGSYLVYVPSVQSTVPAGAPAGATFDEVTSGDALVNQIMFTGLGTRPRGDALLGVDRSARLVLGNYATPPPPSGDRALAYPIVFHPGASSPAGAASVTLGLGEERGGVDVAVEPVPTGRVSGRLEGPPDVIASLPLKLLPAGLEELPNGGEAATTIADANGNFTFLHVPRGVYTIDARRATTEFTQASGASGVVLPSTPGLRDGGSGSSSEALPSAPPGVGYATRSRGGPDLYWTRATVTVDAANIADLVVTLHRTLTLSGRMVFEGTTRAILTAPMGGASGGARGGLSMSTTRPPATLPIVYAEPAGGDPRLGRPRSEVGVDAATTDRFTIDGLVPGEYVLRVPMRAGEFSIKSITIGGEDYTNRAFDPETVRGLDEVVLTFTDQVTTVQGRVRDERGPVTTAAVIAFPAEREQWTRYGLSPTRVMASPLAGASTFTLRGLTAGNYLAFAGDPSIVSA